MGIRCLFDHNSPFYWFRLKKNNCVFSKYWLKNKLIPELCRKMPLEYELLFKFLCQLWPCISLISLNTFSTNPVTNVVFSSGNWPFVNNTNYLSTKGKFHCRQSTFEIYISTHWIIRIQFQLLYSDIPMEAWLCIKGNSSPQPTVP